MKGNLLFLSGAGWWLELNLEFRSSVDNFQVPEKFCGAKISKITSAILSWLSLARPAPRL